MQKRKETICFKKRSSCHQKCGACRGRGAVDVAPRDFKPYTTVSEEQMQYQDQDQDRPGLDLGIGLEWGGLGLALASTTLV